MTKHIPVHLAYNIIEPATGVDSSLSPVIFLHGATAAKESWKDIPQLVANKTKRKVYVLDARNHGDSEWSDDFDLEDNVQDLFHFMDSKGIHKAILIGHSMGGETCMKAALKNPERVEKFITEDISISVPKSLTGMFRLHNNLSLEAVKDVPPELGIEEASKFILNQVYNELPDDLKKYYKNRASSGEILALKRNADGRYIFKTNMEALQKLVKNHETHWVEPDGVYDGSVCFIYGRISPFRVGEQEHYIKKFFPNAEFIGIEDATHCVHSEKLKEFTDAVLKFLCESK